jgi:Asp-tRNA(Asn)/Glu-tRNA(Gln) amidotransferase A subunit family amidase
VRILQFALLVAVIATQTSACRRQAVTDFDVVEKSITDLAKAMASGAVTSAQLVALYLDRIEAYDRHSPGLKAMLAMNPRAREEAEALDRERHAKGPRGPLHGIPIVIKDNFDTADMPTTGGAIALAGSRPSEDAFQVRRLREAGAVVIGKTNMHELAWGITTVSSLGGQTLNPYDPRRNPGGSSGGTAAAVAANFAVAGMGTDTCGSIRYPAAHNNLVGLRSTPGMSSRSGVLPASHTQDIAGPLTRTVEDLAIMLDATVGPDPTDPITAHATERPTDSFTSQLDANGLAGARIGLLEPLFGAQPEDQPVARVVRAAIRAMETRAAESVTVDIPEFDRLLQGASVPQREFKFDFDEYLRRTPKAPARSLAEILDKGLYHASVDQNLQSANKVASLDTKEYRDSLAKRDVIRETILQVMNEQQVDALAYPSLRRTASRIGEPQRGGNCTLSSVTGLPAITVPAGFAPEDGMPVGLELLGRPFSDARLVKLAYAYEQATHHRRPPASTPSLTERNRLVRLRLVTADADRMSRVSANGQLTYDPVARRLDYVVTVAGGSPADVLSTDIHRAERGKRGPIVHVLGGRADSRPAGSVALSAPESADLLSGRLYVDVHTRGNLVGEARAQLEITSPDKDQ